MLVQAGLAKDQHWQVYLPAVLVVRGDGRDAVCAGARGYLRAVFLGAIGLIAGGAGGAGRLSASGAVPSLWVLAPLLFVFFCGFNVLEASQPSMASRVAPPHARGAALGSTTRCSRWAFFAGGALGGWLAKGYGPQALFAACAGHAGCGCWWPGPCGTQSACARRQAG
jgi:predicted MFS family arabinose efflux permease